MRDRVLHLDLLVPAIDVLLEDCSHGYRRGRSRSGAARAVQEAYRDELSMGGGR